MRLLIDTDPGIDDALALVLALTSPEVEVMAISTVAGNVSVDQATTNALPHPRGGRPDVASTRGAGGGARHSSAPW